jgi:hypothetical protein
VRSRAPGLHSKHYRIPQNCLKMITPPWTLEIYIRRPRTRIETSSMGPVIYVRYGVAFFP